MNCKDNMKSLPGGEANRYLQFPSPLQAPLIDNARIQSRVFDLCSLDAPATTGFKSVLESGRTFESRDIEIDNWIPASMRMKEKGDNSENLGQLANRGLDEKVIMREIDEINKELEELTRSRLQFKFADRYTLSSTLEAGPNSVCECKEQGHAGIFIDRPSPKFEKKETTSILKKAPKLAWDEKPLENLKTFPKALDKKENKKIDKKEIKKVEKKETKKSIKKETKKIEQRPRPYKPMQKEKAITNRKVAPEPADSYLQNLFKKHAPQKYSKEDVGENLIDTQSKSNNEIEEKFTAGGWAIDYKDMFSSERTENDLLKQIKDPSDILNSEEAKTPFAIKKRTFQPTIKNLNKNTTVSATEKRSEYLDFKLEHSSEKNNLEKIDFEEPLELTPEDPLKNTSYQPQNITSNSFVQFVSYAFKDSTTEKP